MSKLHKLVAGTAMATTVAVGFNSLAGADIYTVKSGDTLWDIARNNGTTVEQLMKDNHLTSSLIFPGDQLSFQNVATQVAQAEENGYYRVVLGDTLFKIASKFGTTVDKLVELNKISNPNFILVGQSLNVSGKALENVEVKAEAPKSVVKVEEKKAEAPKSVVKVEEKKAEAPAKVEASKPAPAAAPAKVEEKKAEAPAKVEPPKPAPAPAPAKVEAPKPAPAPAPVVSGSKAASIFAAAQSQVGIYQDCTMLVTNALRSVGINFHGWPAGYLSLGTVVPASQAVPGDLIYYANGGMGLAHIAVYAGNGQAVHGGWNGNQTVVNTAYVGSGPVFIRVA